MTDPYDLGWRPDYTGPDPELGDVGSGSLFGVDLYHLYFAGRQRLPKISVRYADMTDDVHETHTYSRGEFSRPNGSFHPAHTLWMELRDELQDILRVSSTNFWDTGAALVQIASLYAATDEEAAAAFSARLDKEEQLGGFPITELPPAPSPPTPGDHAPPPPPPGEEESASLPPPPGEGPGENDRSSIKPAWRQE